MNRNKELTELIKRLERIFSHLKLYYEGETFQIIITTHLFYITHFATFMSNFLHQENWIGMKSLKF